MVAKVKEQPYDIGVIIGRFQVSKLHEAHMELIDAVRDKHQKVVILLGTTVVLCSKRNPLDFETRRLMLQREYPTIPVVAIPDQASDEEWSKDVARRIREVYPSGSVVLYGGRDSFIAHYKGQFPTRELEPSVYVNFSGTESREQDRNGIRATEDFRAGCVYAACNRYPTVYPVVDVAILRQSEEDGKKKTEVLLGRRHNYPKWQFIGGFADPTDTSWEMTGRREVMEETGVEIAGFEYVTSRQIDDHRFRNEIDKMMSTLFIGWYAFGVPQPNDDIHELKWFPVNTNDVNETIMMEVIRDSHKPFATALVNYLYEKGKL